MSLDLCPLLPAGIGVAEMPLVSNPRITSRTYPDGELVW
jgi:hypothetical protein